MGKYAKGGRPPGTGREPIRWDLIKAEYFTGKVLIKDLAVKYDVHPNSITKRKAAEKWDEESARLRMNMAHEINAAALAEIMDDEKERIKRINRVHEQISDLMLQAATKQLKMFVEHGTDEEAGGVRPGKLQSDADVLRTIGLTVNKALETQRKILRLEDGIPTEAEEEQLIKFVEATAPEGSVPAPVDEKREEGEVPEAPAPPSAAAPPSLPNNVIPIREVAAS